MFGISDQYVADLRVDGISYPLSEGRLQGLRVIENASYFCPVAELILDDKLNILTEVLPFTGSEEFELGLGRDPDELEYHTFNIFGARISGSQTTHYYTLPLISKAGYSLVSKKRFKSYASKKISEVVTEIAGELGLTAKVEVTEGSRNWFCPGWTYAQFLMWLSERARSVQHGTSGFLRFVDLNDTLHFYSLDYAMRSTEYDVLDVSPILDEEGQDNPLYGYRVISTPGTFLMLGGLGATRYYYDLSSGTFTESSLDIEDTVHSALCDQIGVKKASLDPAMNGFNGGAILNSDELDLVNNKLESDVIQMINSIMRMEVLVQGNLDLKVGRKVKVTLPSAFEESVVNQVFSGLWMIEAVTHQLVPGFVTKLMLNRSGVDAADDRELVVPPGGKV